MKSVAKRIVAGILGWQVRRLRAKYDFKIIAVAGSIGKTSTKLSIAQVLSQKYKVRVQDGNYNDQVSVPLIFFSQKMPNIYNPLAWLNIFWRNEGLLKRNYPYEIVIVELGPDGPGQMIKFAKYLQVDLAVVTAITPEHMAFFADLDAVAREELAIVNFSDQLLINMDLCPKEYWQDLEVKNKTYGVKQPADYRITNIKFNDEEASFDVSSGSSLLFRAAHELISEPQLYSVCAAIATGVELGMGVEDIKTGLKDIKPVSGRMQHLGGIKGSTILDDTYNASPEAIRAALVTLYRYKAPQKIAVLGNMNELGGYSQIEHQKIGEYCDPKELDLLITIGPDANKYLAPAAEAKGCTVQTFDNPYTAGEYLKAAIKENAVVLVKGSQNKVFAEETVKLVLASSKDSQKLVRQSKGWLKIKRKAFPSVKI